MKIAQISPLWERVPPPAYGGTEGVVYTLTEGLVSQGHQVTLFASGDSTTSATLRSVCLRSLRTARSIKNYEPYNWIHVAEVLKSADEFDVIHNHSGELAMAMSHLVETPMLSTMHCIITPDTRIAWDRYRGFYNTISWAEKRAMPRIKNRSFVGVIYHGIDVASFPFKENKQDYLLYLSRVAAEKGTHIAIEVAKRLGKKLIVAGKVDKVDREYFVNEVKWRIDGRLVRFFGEADAQQKRELYANASCLLLPIDWDEPFGLVLAEAMACGTPVVAFDRGAAREIVADGETGYVVGDIEGMIRAVRKAESIDPRRCRQHVEERFGVQQMVDAYLSAYERVLNARRR